MATFYTHSRTFGIMVLFLLTFFKGMAQQQTLENNQICMDPIAGRGAFINSVNTGLCLGCTAANGANIIDGNLANFSTLTTGVSLLGSGSAVSVKDSLQYYPGGNTVGFVVGTNNTLLTASILNNIQIRTYRNGNLVQTATFNSGSGLLTATAFGGGTGKQILSFTTTAGNDFDEVQLFASNGLLGALSALDVYYAFEGPASCPLDCVNALVGTADATGTTTGTSGVCILGGVSNPGNAIDTDTTNAAQISLGVGVACSRYLQVALANTISNGPGDVYAGFVVQQGSGLLDANVLGNITITTYLNGSGALQTISGASLLTASILGGTRVQLGFKVTQPFNRIRISAGGLLSVGYDLNVYYAFTKTDTDADGMLDCMDKCAGNDLLDTDGDGIPNFCDQNMADLAITKTVNEDSVVAGTDVTFTVTVTRQADSTGFEAPTGVTIKDLLPTGLTYVSHLAPAGTFYNQTTGIWTVGSALSGPATSLALTITASADSGGVLSNIAQVQSMNEGDPDSTPGNGTTGAGGSEDDIASACVSVPIFLCPGSTLSLSAPSGATGYQWFRNSVPISGATDSTYTVTESGSYTFTSSVAGACLSGNCCPVVVIYRVLVADAGTDPTPVCAGTAVPLTGSGAGAGGSYLWSTGETTASISVSPTATTIYILTVTSVDGCVDRDTVVVTVNPKPLIGSVIAVCSNAGTTDNSADDTFTFTLNPDGGSGTTYTVSGITPTGPFNYGAPQNFGPFPASSGNKIITITDANTCTATVTVVAPAGGCSNCSPTPVCIPVTVKKLQ